MSEGTILRSGVGELLSTATEAATPVFVVNPGVTTARRIIETHHEECPDTTVRLLANEQVLKEVVDDFVVASMAADLVHDERLIIRTDGGAAENTLIVSEEVLITVITVNGDVYGLATDEPSFVSDVCDRFASLWASANEFRLRTPPITEVTNTMGEEIGPEVAAEFTAVLQAIDAARDNGGALDEVTICLLVAAANDVLLYDISKWGEDVGIASKATFSRTKSQLEERGLLDTEKVPIDVGRPRLRLKLADERLLDATPDQLADVALSAAT